MPKVDIAHSHNLTAAEAKTRLEKMSSELSAKYGLTSTWLSDTEAKVERTGATGKIKIEANRVTVNLDLSFVMSPMKSTIETKIKEELKKNLEG